MSNLTAQSNPTPFKSAHEAQGVGAHQTLLKKAISTCREGADSNDTLYWYFAQLENLFDAIQKLDGNEFSPTSRFADLGRFLAATWANDADALSEQFEAHFEALKAALSASDIADCACADHVSKSFSATRQGVAV